MNARNREQKRKYTRQNKKKYGLAAQSKIHGEVAKAFAAFQKKHGMKPSSFNKEYPFI